MTVVISKLSVLFFLLFIFSSTQAQILSGTDARPHIDVTGSAETDITPDIIIISVRLKEYEENKVKVGLDKIDRDFLNAITESKIDKKNVEISDISASAITPKRKDRVTYAQKTYKITFSKVEDVLLFFENLKKIKSDYVDLVKLSHTQLEKYRLEIKIAALKAAMTKADALAAAAGVKRGKVLIIEEATTIPDYLARSNSNVIYRMTSNTIIDDDYDGDSDSNQVPFEKINLRFEIHARFELE